MDRFGQFKLDYLIVIVFFTACILFIYSYVSSLSSIRISNEMYKACAISEAIVNYLDNNETKLMDLIKDLEKLYSIANTRRVNLTVKEISGKIFGCVGSVYPRYSCYCERVLFNSSVYILEVRTW